MDEYRRHIRLDCKERCYLHVDDSYYPATLDNISLGGALVLYCGHLPGACVGGKCKLSLNGTPAYGYVCEITRIATPNVALKFVAPQNLKSFDQQTTKAAPK
jgi:hypothetical protein